MSPFMLDYYLFFQGLENCCNLLELSLENNCILKLDGISKLHKLQRLNVSNNYISFMDPSVLNHMKDLVYIAMENNRLTSLLGLQRVESLVELYVGNNFISNVREIFCLKVTDVNVEFGLVVGFD